jgi:hypothetical protein
LAPTYGEGWTNGSGELAGVFRSHAQESAGSGRAGGLAGVAASANLVADTANRSNKRAIVAGVHFAAKVVDVDIDDVGHGG